MSTQCRDTRRLGAATVVLLFACGGCGAAGAHELPEAVHVFVVHAPRGGDSDSIGMLTDGQIARDGWYCSDRPPPLEFELMTADGMPQPILGVAFVMANFGPDGIGPVQVRVQRGHGVAAPGESYEALVHARPEQLVVFRLPAAVEGDHVVVRFARRSAYATALCIGEISAYSDLEPTRHQHAMTIHPERVDEPQPSAAGAESSGTPSSESPASGATEGDPHRGDAAPPSDAGLPSNSLHPNDPAE